MKIRQFLFITVFFFINVIAFAIHRIVQHQKSCIDATGETVVTRILVPEGFHFVNRDKNSFAGWLQNCKVKPNGFKAHLYNGMIKQPDNIYDAVLDVDIGNKDLQQCADAVIRLRAEYLFASKQFDKIYFNLTNGDRVDYNKYAEGFRPIVHGNKISWNKNSVSDYSYATFRNYLDFIFNYAGTLSLSKELISVVDLKTIQAGDVFIKGGSPGHACIVMNVAKNDKTGEVIFIIAQSYMPAQEIHVLKNFGNKTISPWYSINFGNELETPQWDFYSNQLMRFRE